MKYLLLALPTLLIYTGISKLNALKAFIETLNVVLNKIHNIKVNLLKNKATFLADITIVNPNKSQFNLETIGLVKLKRVLFYEPNGVLIGSGVVNISAINIEAGEDFVLKNIPFSTSLTTGFAKLKTFLQKPETTKVLIELEFEAFNKTYKTQL